MTQYFTDFSEYSTGSAPSDWTRRHNTTGVGWTVEADAGATGGKVLRRGTASGTDRRSLSWDAIDSDPDRDDVEILFRFRSATKLDARAFVRGSGGSGNETMYTLGLASPSGNNTLRVGKYDGGTFTALNDTAYAGYTTNTWFWCRMQVQGTTLRRRVWEDGTTEPTSWVDPQTDSAVTAAGWVGVFNFQADAVDIDLFGVGTNGDTAPSEAVGGVSGGSEATVTVSSEGAGTKHARGGSETTVTVLASGGGHAVGVISGGSESNVTVAATGGGRKVAYGASETTVTVAVDSAGFKRGIGGSESNLTVDAEGVGTKHTAAGSLATITVDAL
ncbi:MAG: hypothetical protein WEF28_09220, partial [Acidimicrobiia bacterium]